MLLQIDATEPEHWLVAEAAHVLRRGGVAVIPTDTVYGVTCQIGSVSAIERLYALKKLDPKKPLSILLPDIGMVGRYSRTLSTPSFRLMKRLLPGPYTFIVEASSDVPRIMLRKRKTIGLRIPDNPIALELLAQLDEPLLTTSIRNPDNQILNDPQEMALRYGSELDMVIDGGPLLPIPSTVVDLSGRDPVLLREGRGDVSALGLFD